MTMSERDMISLLEKQIAALENAGVDMRGDRQFFEVGEFELALEGVYVENRRHPGILLPEEVQTLVEALDMDTSDFDR
jgi:hypothetical protein